jgi:phosphonate transport system substrate-binding protein
MPIILKRLVAALLLCIAASVVQAANGPQELYLGSVAMDVPAEMVKRLTPLTQYLTKQTGINVSFRASPNLGSAVNELGKDFTQIAYLTPVAYIEAHDKFRAQPLVSPLTHGKSTFTLVIAVRRDSPFQTMEDLRGRTFAFGDQKALLQRAVVVGGGVKLEEFSRYSFLKHYDNIAKAVLNKDFDAGILKDTIFDEFEPKGLRRLYTSPRLSSYLFAVSGLVPPETAKKLRDAFMALNAKNPEHLAILKGLDQGYDGFEPVEDKDYDAIRKLIAPFQNQPK